MSDWQLRALNRNDAESYLAHWLALSGPVRYRCFGRIVSEAELHRLAETLVVEGRMLCGMFAPDGTLACVAQAFPCGDGCFELSFSVLPQWRGNGFARNAGERLCRMLGARGARELRLRCQRSNLPMRALAVCLGFDLSVRGDGLVGVRTLMRPGAGGLRADLAQASNQPGVPL
ncbi:GNAT family N-acetyltransferase [Niveibacterium sp. SC-1]|uniref:GNAT family N-acetyltransferase n=1 Tax=Niveibacterium sp. SC-1 TaxID=3135646 RepID=UPI00311D823B